MKTLAAITAVAVVLASGLLAGGCQSEVRMTAQEAANFRGAPEQPMTVAKRKEMADFQEEFRRRHPGSAAPPRSAPANLPPSGPSSNASTGSGASR